MYQTKRANGRHSRLSTFHHRIIAFCLFAGILGNALYAQTITPSQTITIEASTMTLGPTMGLRHGSCIFPNGTIGLLFNTNQFRIYQANGTLVRTINLTSAAGFTPRKVIGLSNNKILVLNMTSFVIIDENGVRTTNETSTGMTNYFSNYNLDAVELSNGNIAFSQYNSSSSPEVRVMTQAGAAVSSPLSIKSSGTGRPTPINNQFYSGNVFASKDGGFIIVYRTYLMGMWAMIFNNDGTMRTWPSTGLNHRKLSPGNQEYCETWELPNGGYMLHFNYNKTSNVIIDGNGNTISTTLTRPYNSTAFAVNHKANNGYYVNFATGETIGQNWDGTDDFTGNAGIFAEARRPDGTVEIASTQIGTGYFDVLWDDWDWWYNPDIRPGIFPVSSLRGASGYGVLIQNFAPNGASFSLTLNLYEMGLSTLPVKVESFTGKTVENGNLLEWTTSSEINAKKFEIEYSAAGNAFTKIGEVPAGNTKYNYLDVNAVSPVSYYRLRMVDIDGTAEYSKVVKITNSTEAAKQVKVYPVPASGHCWVELAGASAGKRFAYRIVTATGSEVQKGFLVEPKQKLSLSGLKAGVYYLNIADHGTQKLIVK